jgi:hypothetical protein
VPLRSTLTQDVERYAARLYSVAAARAEADAARDSRVPDGKPRSDGRPKLRESFVFDRHPRRQGTRFVGTARNTAPHARYTVDGTVPHTIVPRSARVLHWSDDGAEHFARRVNHPGTPPSNWWDQVTGDVWPRALAAAAALI